MEKRASEKGFEKTIMNTSHSIGNCFVARMLIGMDAFQYSENNTFDHSACILHSVEIEKLKK